MIVRVRRNPTLKRRIKQIHRELSHVDQSLESLADSVDESQGAVDAYAPTDAVVEPPKGISRADPDPAPAAVQRADAAVKARGVRIRDERFLDYLSSSFQPARPLKREKNIQRNKAIVMLGVLLIVVYWFVVRFWG
jgi:hypothetical protein